MQVWYDDGSKKDIIHFYNDYYIKKMKDAIISIKNNTNPTRTPVVNPRSTLLTPQVNKQCIRVLCPDSPLVKSLPNQAQSYNLIFTRNNTTTPTVPRSILASPLQLNPGQNNSSALFTPKT